MQNVVRSKVVFKDYNHNQNLLLPPSLEELIAPNHPVRVVKSVEPLQKLGYTTIVTL